MKSKKLYVVMRLEKWGNMKACTPTLQPIAGPNGTIGCLLVFPTLKALRKEYGRNAAYQTIRPAEKEQEQ